MDFTWIEEPKPELKSPKRSLLFRLEPIGIGTIYVESLCSYLCRLAEEHGLTLPLLYRTLFDQGRPVTFSQFNACSNKTERYVELLEKATYHTNLRFMTFLPWKHLVSSYKLGSVRKWCPYCLQEWANTGQTIYEPLLWFVAALQTCPVHHTNLVNSCPNCSYTQTDFMNSTSYRVGHCAKCGAWLGQETMNLEKELSDPYAAWTEETICSMITALTETWITELKPETFMRFFTYVRSKLSTESSLYRTISTRMCVARRIELDTLIQMTYETRLPFIQSIRIFEMNRRELPIKGIRPPRNHLDSHTLERYKEALSIVLKNPNPPSVVELARELNTSCNVLKAHFPKEYNELSRMRAQKKANTLAQIRKRALSLIVELRPEELSVKRVAQELGNYSWSSFKRHYPDLVELIKQRRQEYEQEFQLKMYKEVYDISIYLLERGMYPSQVRLQNLISSQVNVRQHLYRKAVEKAIKDFRERN